MGPARVLIWKPMSFWLTINIDRSLCIDCSDLTGFWDPTGHAGPYPYSATSSTGLFTRTPSNFGLEPDCNKGPWLNLWRGAGESAAAPMKFCEEFCDGLWLGPIPWDSE